MRSNVEPKAVDDRRAVASSHGGTTLLNDERFARLCGNLLWRKRDGVLHFGTVTTLRVLPLAKSHSQFARKYTSRAVEQSKFRAPTARCLRKVSLARADSHGGLCHALG